MKVLNAALYRALESLTGRDPSVGRGGEQASWSVPSEASTGFDVAREYVSGTRKRLKRAMVERHSWGEVYSVDCPVCGDTRGRLGISHASLCRVDLKSGQAEFGLNAHCFNESCESTRRDEFRRLVYLPLARLLDPRPVLESCDVELSSDGNASGGPNAAARMRRAASASGVPKPAWPVHSPEAPREAAAYLESRGFDPEWLYSSFSVLSSAKGAAYRRGEEEKTLWDTRVIIPVYQGGALVGWQGRAVEAGARPKYVFPLGCDKSSWLYNKDYAKFRRNVLVTEGVTNVWAFASVCDEEVSSAVATFGKSVSRAQMLSMSRLWGFDGAGVLCLDPDAAHLIPSTVDAMLAAKCFGRGLSVLLLDDGEDPASMVEKGRGRELVEMFDEKCAAACLERDKILAGLEGRIARAASKVHSKKDEQPFGRLL